MLGCLVNEVDMVSRAKDFYKFVKSKRTST